MKLKVAAITLSCLFVVSLIIWFIFQNPIATVFIMKSGKSVPERFKEELQFETRLGLIIIPVEIKGETYDFVLDTGAPSVISKELASKLKLKPSTYMKAKDSQSNSKRLGLVRLERLAIGGAEFLNTGAAIADLYESNEISCLKVDGFIGANLMQKAVWKIDYLKKRITIANEISEMEIPTNTERIPFETKLTGTPIIELELQGGIKARPTIDLGSNGKINLNNQLGGELVQTKEMTYLEKDGIGNSGLFGKRAHQVTRFISVPEIALGTIKLMNQVLEFSHAKEGSLGNGFLKHYDVIIDWHSKELLLDKKSDFPPQEINSFGFELMYRAGALRIGAIFKNSSADKQGLKIGDRVQSINGIDYSMLTPSEWCDLMTKEFSTDFLKMRINSHEYTLEKEILLH